MRLPVTDDETKVLSALAYAQKYPDPLIPIYIPSHKRATQGVPTQRKILRLRGGVSRVIVAEPEEDDYRLIGGVDLNYYGPGIGLQRQFILDEAKRAGHEIICMIDDDLLDLVLLYKGIGDQTSSDRRWCPVSQSDMRFGILQMMSDVALDAFAEEPSMVIAGPQQRNGSRALEAAATKWETNIGQMPRQLTYWHVDRFFNTVGELDIDRFQFHGEDLYACASVLEHGGSLGRFPSFLSSFGTSSTIKTDELVAIEMKLAEYRGITTSSIQDYLQLVFDKEHVYQGARINWRGIRNQIPESRTVLWDS